MFDWLLTWGQVLSGFGSVLLSAVLAGLYWKMSQTQTERTNIQQEQVNIQKSQTQIMENQQSIMESQNKPMVAAGIGEEGLSPRIVLENVGGRAAINITADWSLNDEDHHWTTPILSSGDRVKIPLLGEPYPNLDEVINEIGDNSDLIIKIDHHSPNHEKRQQEWTFDAQSELQRLNEYTREEDDSDNRYDQSRELRRIRQEIRKLRRK